MTGTEFDVVFDVVVVAGGAGRRMGGTDKGALVVGGRALLDRILLATAGARATVVVGDPRPTIRPVTWTRESPPNTGPLSALSAGLQALPPTPSPAPPTTSAPAAASSSIVLVLAVDLPELVVDDVQRLITGMGDADGAVFSDAEGRWQPLAAVYREGALREAVRALQPVAGRPVRLLFERLELVAVPDHGAAVDCDTPDQLARAQARHGQE